MFGRSTHLIVVLSVAAAALAGCSVVRSVTGTELDGERFARAREAKTMEIRYREAVRLAERLERSNPYNEGAMSVQLSSSSLNTLASWYRGRNGWLDENTHYTVDSISIDLHHGSSIAHVFMSASQEQWDVDLQLSMDCLMRFGMSNTELEMHFEPYNIVPVVGSTGFLVGSASMIENVVKAKLGRISEDFPPLRLPLDFNESLPIDNQMIEVRQGVNMDISFPRRVIDYHISMKEVLVFRGSVFIVLGLDGVQVR